MRAGAIPLLVWCVLIGVLLAVHWVWTGDEIQNASFGFAIGLVVAVVTISALANREVLLTGAPAPDQQIQAVPAASLGAVLTGVAVVACGFGLVFGAFLVFIGGGMLVAGVALLYREVADEKRARRRAADQGQIR